MTKDLDLSTKTNSKEILPQYRDHLGREIKDIFLWVIGQSAITEMTKTVRERYSRAHHRCTNYTHYSDYISHQREMSNTVEPNCSETRLL